MRNPRPSRYSSDAPDQPELSRLEPPAGRRAGGWRLAALLLTVFLGGVILAGRLGMDETADTARSPGPSPVAAATPPGTPRPSPSPAQPATPAPSAGPTLPPSVDVAPTLARYADGLPTSILGEKVYRLETALTRVGERIILVAGWYTAPDCTRLALCPQGLLVDDPADSRTSARALLEGRLPPDNGPQVLRAQIVHCPDRGRCLPTLQVFESVWSGDLLSLAGPIGPMHLLGGLSVAFPQMRAEPFRDLARCPVEWPPQTYRSTTGGPRMVVVFPTTEDRLALEDKIRTNWPRPASFPGAQCLDQFMDAGEPAGWIAEDNVMLWVRQDDYDVALARAALLDARSQSGQQVLPPAPEPVTTLMALRALRSWEPGLEVRPPHELLIWGPGVGREGERRVAEAYALGDPLMPLLLVFPDRVERRHYERDVDPADVVILSTARPTQESVAAAMIDAREAGARWLGYRNVLIQVTGPPRFDRELRAFLRGELP